VIFLMLSAIHFSDDINLSGHQLLKLSYGFAIISLPSLINGEELTNLYGMIVDAELAQQIVLITKYVSLFLLPFLLILFYINKVNLRNQLEIASISILFLLAQCSPLGKKSLLS